MEMTPYVRAITKLSFVVLKLRLPGFVWFGLGLIFTGLLKLSDRSASLTFVTDD